MMFQNREEAGNLLSRKLSEYKALSDCVVLAIPRGGAVVGAQIAAKLSLPLSVVVVKKLGAPGNPELALGAVTQSGIKYIDWELALRSGIKQEYLDKEIALKEKETDEKMKKFRINNLELRIRDKKTIILTDDGVATGATVFAAIKYIKSLQPLTTNRQRITVLAVPIIAGDTYGKIKPEVDRIVALEVPGSFHAVGQFYREFPQVNDEEVMKLL